MPGILLILHNPLRSTDNLMSCFFKCWEIVTLLEHINVLVQIDNVKEYLLYLPRIRCMHKVCGHIL